MKKLARIKFCIKVAIDIILIIGLIVVLQGLSPYIEGTEVWEEMPFTLSQMEALLTAFIFCYLISKTMKVYSKW